MIKASMRILASPDLLLDIFAFAISSIPIVIAGVLISSFPEPLGYIAILYAGSAILLLGQFAYGLLQQRSLIHKFIARLSAVFCLTVIAAFALRSGDYIASSLLFVVAVWIGWFAVRRIRESGTFTSVKTCE